jgi:hypothetical protein
MSDVKEEAQEGAEEKNSEEKNQPGDEGKYASKEELTALKTSVEVMSGKSDELYKLMTSDAFMNRGTPAPAPPPTKPKEKEPSGDEINEYNPSQVIGYMLNKVSGILEEQGKKQNETLNKMGATIQNIVTSEADREVDRQIVSCQKEFGKEDFDKQLGKMAKIAKETPGISARRAYLIAVGEEKPPVKKETPAPTDVEKPGNFGDFEDSKLTPKEAGDKAYDMVLGGKDIK